MAVREDSVGYTRKETLEKESHFFENRGTLFHSITFFWSTREDSIGLEKRNGSPFFELKNWGDPF